MVCRDCSAGTTGSYPAGDWYGGRPKKSLLKTSVMNMLTEIGYARKTIDGVRGTDVVEYRHPEFGVCRPVDRPLRFEFDATNGVRISRLAQ